MPWKLPKSKTKQRKPDTSKARKNLYLVRKYKEAVASGACPEELQKILNSILELNKFLLMKWARSYYNNYSRVGVEYGDLYNEAFIAMAEALNTYKLPEEQENKLKAGFITHAVHQIHGRLHRYVMKIVKHKKRTCKINPEISSLLSTENASNIAFIKNIISDTKKLVNFLSEYFNYQEILLILLYNNIAGNVRFERPPSKRRVCEYMLIYSKTGAEIINRGTELLMDYVEMMVLNKDEVT